MRSVLGPGRPSNRTALPASRGPGLSGAAAMGARSVGGSRSRADRRVGSSVCVQRWSRAAFTAVGKRRARREPSPPKTALSRDTGPVGPRTGSRTAPPAGPRPGRAGSRGRPRSTLAPRKPEMRAIAGSRAGLLGHRRAPPRWKGWSRWAGVPKPPHHSCQTLRPGRPLPPAPAGPGASRKEHPPLLQHCFCGVRRWGNRPPGCGRAPCVGGGAEAPRAPAVPGNPGSSRGPRGTSPRPTPAFPGCPPWGALCRMTGAP